ncbi:nucleotide pyrophosphohydrolase [Desulfoprunum benzoelyticum]|uniref:MazG nucleotide pyrophosphohydrolase domain-containing protein n=1 Tax=Desulfoprunum benzoelyticum TaxID=1506996 RepID=UPI0016209C1D|nr:MazG nucleotide pyrophosphohydrolase domain-containing protein [Desulfoprunum benzoelyticum]MBM9528576.1 nucleotide pyrophosphohydrolase [Desulfoprunum benzoelyticum]
MSSTSSHFAQLLGTVRKLLGEQGCPWDKRQTNTSLKKYLTSELDELIAAIDNGDHENICEELGDLLYLILLVSEINCRNGLFSIDDVIHAVDSKLVRRHPHVFEKFSILSDDELRQQWLAIKSQEKLSK